MLLNPLTIRFIKVKKHIIITYDKFRFTSISSHFQTSHLALLLFLDIAFELLLFLYSFRLHISLLYFWTFLDIAFNSPLRLLLSLAFIDILDVAFRSCISRLFQTSHLALLLLGITRLRISFQLYFQTFLEFTFSSSSS